ncbi:MAG: CaiB/BaiF CoA transferase family protein [Dehalococcoidia bacterium]
MPAPLDGKRVVVLDGGVAGLYAAHVLARFGATTIIVEPAAGHPVRRLSPFPNDRPQRESSGWWSFLARGQRSIVLNLTAPTGKAILRRIPSDVALVPPEHVSLMTDRSVVVVTPHGIGGSSAGAPATDLTLAAAGGIMASSGEADRPPLAPPGPAVHVAAGLFAAIAALYLFQSPDSEQADLALVETVVATGIYETTTFAYRGAVRQRSGPKYSPALVLNTTLRCADGYVGLHLNTQPQWRALCDFMERPDLVEDPRFRTSPRRAANWQELDAIVLPWAASRSAQYLYHEGQRRRVPFSLIPRPSEVLASAQLNARAYFEAVDHPALGPLLLPGAPFRIDGDRGRGDRGPQFGEDTAEVLAEAGVGAAELPRLRAAGILY